ncbi:MAG: hypothetical protein LBU06_05555 [Desulfovibrio sp.]|jgi:hypothetical protein|nr:hypothetical protein [Desulfovibrio sp.]
MKFQFKIHYRMKPIRALFCAFLAAAMAACAASPLPPEQFTNATGESPRKDLPGKSLPRDARGRALPADRQASQTVSALEEERTKSPPAVGIAAAPQAGAVVLRHKVRLEMPGRDIPSFDGILRISRADNTLRMRVLGLGGMGLTLFDINVTPTDAQAAYLSPRLAVIPGLVENIAFCVRNLLPEAGGGNSGEDAGEGWSVSRSGERPWPGETVFRNEKPEYTVRVRLLGMSEERGQP